MSDHEFTVTAIPIGTYATYKAVAADEQAAAVVKKLAELGGMEVTPEPQPDNRTISVVTQWVAAWAEHTPLANTMLFWVGHGETDGNDAWLAAYDTKKPMRGTGMRPESVADHIANHWLRRRDCESWAVIVIEACGATRFVDLLNAELSRRGAPERLILFGSGGAGSSYLGTFSQALSEAVGAYTDNDVEIPVLGLMGGVARRVRDKGQERTWHVSNWSSEPKLRRRPLLPGVVTATVDVYGELQSLLRGLPQDERSHFLPKAQGAEQGELAWYFTGRAQERREICNWLRTNAGGMLVITGRAGCGKSSLLGNILVYSNPDLRKLLVQHNLIGSLTEDERPPDRAFDQVMHLTGLTTAQVVQRLLRAVATGVGDQLSGATVNEQLDEVLSRLRSRVEGFTLLTDALDESQEPTGIAASVLRRIAELPGCRVVVGTRGSTKEGPDQPSPKNTDLLDALGGEKHVITLERDPAAIGEYVRKRLHKAISDAKLPRATPVDDIAKQIGSRPNAEFLFARLAVHEILARPEAATPENRRQLHTLLKADHRGLFRRAVERLAAKRRVNRALLEALALAMGRGLPRADRIWAIVAEAVGRDTGAEVTESDVDHVLEDAAPYIMLDGEGNQSVYRLAHRTFQEHFVGGMRGRTLPSRQARVARALVVAAEQALPRAPNGYLQHHLAEHVALGSRWAHLASRPDVLDRLEPDSVAGAVMVHAFGRAGVALPLEIQAVASVPHPLEPLRPDDRRVTREIATARLSGGAVQRLDVTPLREAAPSLAWAALRPSSFSVPLRGHEGWVTALAAVPRADGRVLLASGSADGTIRLWGLEGFRTLHRWVVGFPLRAMAWVAGDLVVGGELGLFAVAVGQGSERQGSAVP